MDNNNYLKRETHEYTIFIRNFNSSFGTWIKEEKKDFHWLFLNFFKRSKAGYCWNKHNLMLIPPPPPPFVFYFSRDISIWDTTSFLSLSIFLSNYRITCMIIRSYSAKLDNHSGGGRGGRKPVNVLIFSICRKLQRSRLIT